MPHALLSNSARAALGIPLQETKKPPNQRLYIAGGKSLLRYYPSQNRAKLTTPSPNARQCADALMHAESARLKTKEFGIYHEIRDMAHLVLLDRCFIVFDVALPDNAGWDYAIKYQYDYGKRMIRRYGFSEPTYVSVILTEQGRPHALRVFIPDDAEGDIVKFQESSHFGSTPVIELADEIDALHAVRQLYPDLDDSPTKLRKFQAKRGYRPRVLEYEVESVDHATAFIKENHARLGKVIVHQNPAGTARFRFNRQIGDQIK